MQGKVELNSALVDDGNITVFIYDAASSGNLIYNSSTDFNNTIQDGYFDIMLGSNTVLTLNLTQDYWIDISINDQDLNFSGSDRKQFQSPVGKTIPGNLTVGENVDVGGDVNVSGDVSVSSIIGWDGWIPAQETWVYDSSDDPTYTFNITGNKTDKYSAGMRLKLTDSGTQYFIVTKVAYSNPTTTITMYGGTDYNLSTGTITNPYYSTQKAPLSFPLNPDKWIVEVTNTTERTQVNPTSGTWYNLGSISITIPIGIWDTSYQVGLQGYRSGSIGNVRVQSTLSTADNSESDVDLTGFIRGDAETTGSPAHAATINRQKILNLSSKTVYYLNAKAMDADISNIYFINGASKLIIRAVCAYL